jgi:hypothetical protein
MKSVILAAALVAVMAAPSVAGSGPESAWFDMEKCSMCKSLMAQPGLLEHMTWDNQLINTGMMSVSVVEPAYLDAFTKMSADMTKTAKELEAGKQMDLCGMCMSYGALMQSGAKMDEVTGPRTCAR